ncbi:uncharacterized protein BCR38DRAFT_486489 [Pseudomassariella vexata]|uniref:DUF7905 domain-containing protein n=1 Tax=Pseudomassariella vexata TaxID=1141098 RepID=A0A1Y2DSI3_9PEZI|nr:uncharacterized protein BCR38DRAFT_486489 [Pseudomassariella vexata]ORY62218.1 hypothetical protein BCR38DRAFT_486489 [Pseudomassariella vexata]
MAVAPNFRAYQTMEKYFPGCMSVPFSMKKPSEATSTVHDKYAEFILSSNWIFRPEGLKEFYSELRKQAMRPTIEYDLEIGCFRIRCPAGEEGTFVQHANHIMNAIVQNEIQKIPMEQPIGQFGPNTSNKIRHIDEWRLAETDESEITAYEVYSYPPEVADLPFKITWRIPKGEPSEAELTIPALFGNNDPVASLNKFANCEIFLGTDDRSLHIGAKSRDSLDLALKKVDTLVKYYHTPAHLDSHFSHVLYSENVPNFLTEIRYIAQADTQLLKSILLERISFSLKSKSSDYAKVFSGGSFVRMLPLSPNLNGNRPMFPLHPVNPVISEEQAAERFVAFESYCYKPKTRDGDKETDSVMHPPQSYLPSQLAEYNSQTMTGVGILKWAKSLAEHPVEDISADGPTEGLARKIISLPVTEATAQRPGNDVYLPATGHGQVGTPRKKSTALQDCEDRDLVPPSGSSTTPTPRMTNASSQATIPGTLMLSPKKPRGVRRHVSPTPFCPHATPSPSAESSPATNSNVTTATGRERLADLRKRLGQSKPKGSHMKDSKEKPTNDYDAETTSISNQIPNDPFVLTKVFQRNEPVLLDFGDTTASSQPEMGQGEANFLDFSPVNPQNDQPLSWSMEPLLPTPKPTLEKRKPPSFHSTVQQKAGSRSVPLEANQKKSDTLNSTQSNDGFLPHQRKSFTPSGHRREKQETSSRPKKTDLTGPDPSPDVIQTISQKLTQIMQPLRIFKGNVFLKAEIGRFILTKVNYKHISIPTVAEEDRLRTMTEEQMTRGFLDLRHCQRKDLFFTRVVSASGGDANYIASLMEPGSGSSQIKMWTPSGKRVIYEFRCSTTGPVGKKHRFILNVDAENFSYSAQKDRTIVGKVFMHCMKRTYDIQFTVDAVQNIAENYGGFAQELIGSLEVRPQSDGRPRLSFINFLAWGAEIVAVRVRHIAEFVNSAQTCKLEITQVHEMSLKDLGVQTCGPGPSDNASYLEAIPSSDKPELGYFATWYDACVKSQKVDEAVTQNEDLGFGDEATWSPDDLKSAGAFEDLIDAATHMVKNMDGVAYWCDNNQEAMNYRKPPGSEQEIRQLIKSTQREVYW